MSEQSAEIDAGCGATMQAMVAKGHRHVCTGPHDAGDHYCGACGYYFWHAQEALGERVNPSEGQRPDGA